MHKYNVYKTLAVGAMLSAGLLATPMANAQAVPLAERLQLCSGCHNPDGNSTLADNPKLAGLKAGYIARQLADFRNLKRPSAVMGGIIPLVDPSEFEKLSEHFAEQKPAKGVAATDPALAARGKVIFEEGVVASAVPACNSCHGDDGSGDDKYPRIAGQHAAYLVQQLANFKSGARSNDSPAMMQPVARRMNEADMKAVAEYLATLNGGE